MAGRLWLVSRPGEGSTFSFSLPLAESGSLYGAAMTPPLPEQAELTFHSEELVPAEPSAKHNGRRSRLGADRPVLLP